MVDYAVGADPAPGVYVFATIDNADDQCYLELYKRGTGPCTVSTAPYHLCHFEVPASVARAALFGDVTLAPLGPPCVEVVTIAKADLAAGTELDGFGLRALRQCENADVVGPVGSFRWAFRRAAGCVGRRAVTTCFATTTSSSRSNGSSTASVLSKTRCSPARSEPRSELGARFVSSSTDASQARPERRAQPLIMPRTTPRSPSSTGTGRSSNGTYVAV